MNETYQLKKSRRRRNRVRLFWSLFRDKTKKAASVVHGLFPLTWMAVLACGLIYYVWYWEVMPHANQILHAIVLVWLVFIAVLLIFTVVSAVLVWAMTRRANRNVVLNDQNEVGGHVMSGYRVYRPAYLPFVCTECELLEQTYVRHVKTSFLWESEWLEPVGRGRFKALHRRIAVGDIFGMTKISFVMTEPVDLEIMPKEAQFEQHLFKTEAPCEDGYSHPKGDPRGDLVEMRRYQAGDPLRLVLWKVFARSRKLVVRAPEPTLTQRADMFIYFVSGTNDEESASVARTFLSKMDWKNQKEINLCFAADGAKRLVKDASEGISDVIDSVTARSRGGMDIMSIAPQVSKEMMSHCFLLVPRKPGMWLEHIRQFIEQFHVRPTFIVSVESDADKMKKSKKSRLKHVLCADSELERASDDIDALCNKLAPYGAVRIVDIATGIASDIQSTEHVA